MKKTIPAILASSALSLALITGCSGAATSQSSASAATSTSAATASASTSTTSAASTSTGAATATFYQASDVFTSRDLEQTADTSNAKTITLSSGENVTISEEGVYVISGTATDATITVQAADTAKVQLVLSDANITNMGEAAIYVVSADKVFVTTADSVIGSLNSLSAA